MHNDTEKGHVMTTSRRRSDHEVREFDSPPSLPQNLQKVPAAASDGWNASWAAFGYQHCSFGLRAVPDAHAEPRTEQIARNRSTHRPSAQDGDFYCGEPTSPRSCDLHVFQDCAFADRCRYR
jgi:hypothetical protein